MLHESLKAAGGDNFFRSVVSSSWVMAFTLILLSACVTSAPYSGKISPLKTPATLRIGDRSSIECKTEKIVSLPNAPTQTAFETLNIDIEPDPDGRKVFFKLHSDKYRSSLTVKLNKEGRVAKVHLGEGHGMQAVQFGSKFIKKSVDELPLFYEGTFSQGDPLYAEDKIAAGIASVVSSLSSGVEVSNIEGGYFLIGRAEDMPSRPLVFRGGITGKARYNGQAITMKESGTYLFDDALGYMTSQSTTLTLSANGGKSISTSTMTACGPKGN